MQTALRVQAATQLRPPAGRSLGARANYGMAVFGHSSVGHRLRNPVLHRFPSSRGETVAPSGQIAGWVRAMASTTPWARFAFMPPAEITAQVQGFAWSHLALPHHAAPRHAPAGH